MYTYFLFCFLILFFRIFSFSFLSSSSFDPLVNTTVSSNWNKTEEVEDEEEDDLPEGHMQPYECAVANSTVSFLFKKLILHPNQQKEERNKETKKQRNKEKKKQRNKETKKQRNKETKKQRNKKTKKQRNKETKKQRNKETKKQRNKE